MKRPKHKAQSTQERFDAGKFALQDIPKENPFLVPEGYFDRLPGQILDRISRPSGTVPFSAAGLRYMKWPYKAALAASFLLIGFVIAYTVFSTSGARKKASETMEITTSDLFEFEGYLVDLDESLVDEWIDQAGDQVDGAMVDLSALDELSESDLVNYLLKTYSLDELPIEP